MYKEITTARSEHKKLFYKIINRQSRLNELVVNGEYLSDSDGIRQWCADCFKT